MMTLPGYHLGEHLYQGTRTLVYRGTRITDSQAVIIKLLRNEYPTFAELAQFRNQYAITKNLNLPGIVQPLALENYGNGYALVMPFQGYISLGQWQQDPVSLGDFLSIALQLADILHQLDRHRVIHKDIKPANILIHPQTKHVQLIDFSISSLLPKETQEIRSPNTLEGTLAYISPEQTGRMNRGIDYRSDFYSLGVTFYELLAGELPFYSDDPMELVHCHLARFPVPPDMRKHKIPQMLSDMVLKLMAKNAEDRYQSALGLKYDLEKCLSQWKETGNIERFELGERDICDRFIIPEKLYGREAEVERLLAAFNRVAEGNTEMMLVAGFSGIGKTAVINEIHKPITRQQGYFIQGKFDQFNRNVPLSAFVQAFRSLIKQLLGESDAALAMWKAKILDAVGVNGQVLIEVIPELEAIIDAQPAVPELSGSAAQNRFNLLFGKFARVFATPEHPLAIFLDDLQWADLASLKLLKLFISELASGYLFVLGAYRDNEVFAAHPLMLTLDEIDKPLETLTLAPLQASDITQLVADTLLCSPELAAPLSHLVYQKTQGNPFFTTQFLVGLYEEGCIAFDGAVGCWQCDLACVRQLALTDDVVAFMMGRLRKLSESTQTVLKFAACIGNRFNLETLAVVSESHPEEVAANLWPALREGLVVPESETYKFFQGEQLEARDSKDICVGYRFLHDRVQQAAYSLIPEPDRRAIHLTIGQLLLEKTPEWQREERLFDIVGHLNLGVDRLTDSTARIELAQLNLKAGQKANSSTAYTAAFEYTSIGIQLLPTDCWSCQYSLALGLHETAAEAAYLSGKFDGMERLAAVVLDNARDIPDKIKVYELQIQKLQSQGQMLEAVKLALQILENLGLRFPLEPTASDIERAFLDVALILGDRDPLSFIEHLQMSNRDQLAIMRILNAMFGSTYLSSPALLPLTILKQVELSLKSGNSPESPGAYANYGLLLCISIEQIDLGYQFSELALALLKLPKFKAIQANTINVVFVGIQFWKKSLRKTIPNLLEGYQGGLESGDLESTSYCIFNYLCYSFHAGKELLDLNEKFEIYSEKILKTKKETACRYINLLHQTILNLTRSVPTPEELSDPVFCEEIETPKLKQFNDRTGLAFLYIQKLMLGYWLGNIERARKMASIAVEYLDGVPGMLWTALFYWYDSLTKLALVASDSDENCKNSVLYEISPNQAKMQQWANFAPENFAHKYALVEAEKYRVLGQTTEAIEYYDRAIAGAKANEYLQEEALANELAAKFYLDWGKHKIAQTYMVEAYYCYARWGAKAKTDHLEATYPQLLTSILQQPKSPFGTNATSTFTSHPTLHSSTKTTTSILDLTSAMKASQALSGEIELEALLSKLTHIVLENAGADKGGLILQNSGTWEVAAFCEGGTCHLCLSSLDKADPLPMSIVRTVQRTQQTIVLNRVEKDAHFSRDAYLKQQQPKSLCCTPILNQGRLIGILYLENNLSEEAFTRDRLEVLNLLCSQAAISLENARLYENAQAANKMLQKSLEDLKQAQLQIVQSEKMSALGNLVAGVAHEINNPVGFIGGNLQPARDYIQDLFGLIDLYREKYPNGDREIEEQIEAIELDFLREDLPKLMGSMKLGVERIAHISTSLRTFSRTDKEHKVPFNLHEGIDSTLLILKHRLKANEQRPKIEIIKNYGNIPEVRCFPGQLNQVFMNLMANAIDALDESNEGRSFEEIAANPNQITIQTQIHEKQVIILMADNGVGIPENLKARIFEQGFTTKGVGKGTGLGMAISRQIVEEKHGGTIACSSQPGKGTEFAIALRVG